MQVLLTSMEQANLSIMQAIAASAEATSFQLVDLLLFSSDYRVSGANVSEIATPNGSVQIDPGVFLKAGGTFYENLTEAIANIISGTPNPGANIWGTGQAADAAFPRKDIICVSYQQVPSQPQTISFINPATTPPSLYTQTVNTVLQGAPIFTVVHGTPSATPSEPAIPSGYLKLATVLVPANATTVTNSDITNNLNINVKTLEELQIAGDTASAFSDVLWYNGVYENYLNAFAVSQYTTPNMSVIVNSGAALLDGVTVNITTETTVPVDASSFVSKSGESVSFASGNVQTLQADGHPPHQIVAGSVAVAGYVENTDYSIQYAAGTITWLPGGSIPSGGTISINYSYYLPRIDIIEINFASGQPQITPGTPSSSPVAPPTDPNCLLLAYVYVGENVTSITNANITDERFYLASILEVIIARSTYPNLNARITADETVLDSTASTLAAHVASNITSTTAVHGIKQGSGNGFDADTVDTFNASYLLARGNQTGVQPPATISPQGAGSTLNADLVDGFNASATPTPGLLLPLNAQGQFPASVISLATVGNSLKNGLTVASDASTPTTLVDIAAAILSVQGVILANVSVSANITVSGAGGLDTGSKSSSTWYYIFVITNATGSSSAGLLSLSATAPTLPSGYTLFRRVGAVYCNSSGNLLTFTRYGDKVYYPAGIAMSFAYGTAQSFTTAIPPTSTLAQIYFSGSHGNPGSGYFSVAVRPTGTATYKEVLADGSNVSAVATVSIDLMLSSGQEMDISSLSDAFTLAIRVDAYYDPV